MAQLQSTSITGSLSLAATTVNTGSCGNLWFNTSTNKLQYSYYGGAWSAGGAMITDRNNLAGAGTQTAALAFGGASPAIRACTETYNGTSWSAGGALSTARYNLGGAGTNTAALAFGGFTLTPVASVACTETYNGSTWSTGGALITARSNPAGAGTNTAALAFGGSPALACTETYCIGIQTCTP